MTESTLIRVGLVGFGAASRIFHAPLITAVDGLELAAVVERNDRVAEQAYPGIATYVSLEAMLAAQRREGTQGLNLVVIPTPNPTHAPLAHQALAAGCHVVVDKPAGIDPGEIQSLITHAAEKGRLFVPFHNRRWDSDFRTIQKLLLEAQLGNVYYFESTLDRWRPKPRLNMWKENGDPGGGNLLDLGTHIVDQALQLFGLPESLTADVLAERENAVTDDAFTIRLRYSGRHSGLRVVLSANCLASIPRPRFTVRGTLGNFVKFGLDPQEARLKESGTGYESPGSTRKAEWGEEPSASWGTLATALRNADGEATNEFETSRVESLPGDYRRFYEGVRDVIAQRGAPPVLATDALHVAQVLEWAKQSSRERREIVCRW